MNNSSPAGDYFTGHEDRFEFPKVELTATVSTAGDRITVVFPAEFIGETVAFVADQHGRHRIILGPQYNGKDVIGFVASDKVQRGKVEFAPGAIALGKVQPGKSIRWYCKQRETDILVGRLFSDLAALPSKPQIVASTLADLPSQVEIANRALGIPKAEYVTASPAASMTIEEALQFVNDWAVAMKADLIVEDNVLYAEVRTRLGGKK